MKTLRALVAALLVVVLPARAWAGPLLAQALAAYERVEYAETVRLLERALPGEALGEAELERAYYILGSALLGEGQAQRAEQVFQTLLALRPSYRADGDASPKVRESLRRAQPAASAPAPRIGAESPARLEEGLVVVSAEMTASSLLQPGVEYRTAGDAPGHVPARTALRCTGGACSARLPAATAGYRFGFLTGEGAFALAAEERRVSLAPPLAPRALATPLYKRWWLWTVVGAVVVGGVTGAIVGGTLSSRSHAVELSIKKDCAGAPCPLWGAP